MTADLKFWGLPTAVVLEDLETGRDGLREADARQRLVRFGRNALTAL
jgi:hypothetical protein